MARAWFGATAVAVVVGLVVQLHVSAGLTGTQFHSTASRLFNVFCYFTVQSNVIVGATTALLAVRLDRRSTVFAVFRLTGLVAITITFVVYHVALAKLQDLHGAAAHADLVLHTVVPIMAVVGWLVFGPAGRTNWRIAGLAVLFPLAWSVFALVRGEIVDFYPYPFVDVRSLGYPRVVLNIVVVGVLYFAVSAGAVVVDRARVGRGAAI
jgi:hypothetical protein